MPSSAVKTAASRSSAEAAGHLSSLFKESSDLVALLSPAGIVLEGNRTLEKRGAGFPFAEFFSPGGRSAVQRAVMDCADTQQPTRTEASGPRRDGSPGWHLVTVAPVQGGTLVALAVDVTERHLEEERLRRAEALMVDTQGVAHLGIWEWDITKPHAAWSPELYRIYRLDPGQHVPTYEDYLRRVHPDDRQRVMDATNEVFHQLQPYSHDERIYRGDGTLCYLHTWAIPILDEQGKLIRLMGVCQDITDRKRAEQALEEHAAELARSNAELEQFAYVASHDLQAPLRAVASYVELLAKRYRGQLDASADEAIGFAVDGVRRMKTLLDDLLEYSRVKSGTKAQCALDEVLERVRSSLADVIAESGATLRSRPLARAGIGGTQAFTLLRNLVANAVQFKGPRPPEIEVSTSMRDGKVELAVRDNGVGIAPEHQQRIFVMFQRLQPDLPGTGIGLAICKKIAERHGGRIWVESKPGEGSTFHVTLPAAQS